MKKILAFLLAVSMIFAMAACAASPAQTTTTEPAKTEEAAATGLGSGFFRRRFGHNRRGRRFRRFFLIAARAQRNQRDGQHQGQKTLLH